MSAARNAPISEEKFFGTVGISRFNIIVIREFSSHVDSDFGYAFLKREFAKENIIDQTKAAIAKIILIKLVSLIIEILSLFLGIEGGSFVL